MDSKIGTRAKISRVNEAHIMARAIEKPRIPRTELARKLQRELRQKGCDVPELEVLQRKISKYRNEIIDGPEDKPWGLLTLTPYDIPAEILSIVFDLWGYALLEYKKPLTIREMKWAVRLCRIISNDKEGLLLRATQYAAYEKAHEVLNDKAAWIGAEIGFYTDTELYAEFRPPRLTGDDILKVPENPDILKTKHQKLLGELRCPEILGTLGFKIRIEQPGQKRGKKKREAQNERRDKPKSQKESQEGKGDRRHKTKGQE